MNSQGADPCLISSLCVLRGSKGAEDVPGISGSGNKHHRVCSVPHVNLSRHVSQDGDIYCNYSTGFCF